MVGAPVEVVQRIGAEARWQGSPTIACKRPTPAGLGALPARDRKQTGYRGSPVTTTKCRVLPTRD